MLASQIYSLHFPGLCWLFWELYQSLRLQVRYKLVKQRLQRHPTPKRIRRQKNLKNHLRLAEL
ncbi:uncharacterized protein DS421_9g268990 [Arachis hypogaea]|nr:uncharacterized protein DS421_9g268990 [Arachis hypogaea]